MATRREPIGDISKRLSLISGHATSVKRLWDEGRDCDEILTQISAVRAALDKVGKIILAHHIEHCMVNAIERGEAESAMRDLKKSLDRFI